MQHLRKQFFIYKICVYVYIFSILTVKKKKKHLTRKKVFTVGILLTQNRSLVNYVADKKYSANHAETQLKV